MTETFLKLKKNTKTNAKNWGRNWEKYKQTGPLEADAHYKREQNKAKFEPILIFWIMTSLTEIETAKKNSRRHPTNFLVNHVLARLQNKLFTILFSGSVGKLSFDLSG